MSEFRWSVRVYWEDTDAGGVVYHAGYLRFMERARTEWLRAAGIAQSVLAEQNGLVFVVSRIQLHFRAPARLDDELQVSVRLAQARRASMELEQQIVRGGDCLLTASVRAACVTADTFQPTPIPQGLLEKLNS